MTIEENTNIEVCNNVIKLKDGTLFLRQKNGGQFQFDYLTGLKKITLENIVNFKKNIKRNKEYCDLRGINYLHVIFPCKAVAYRDCLTSLGINIKPIVTQEHFNTNGVYYPNLDDIKEDWFMKTDTHCSYKGWLFIIKDVMSRIGIAFPNIPFSIHNAKFSTPGDLGRMINGPPVKRECIHFDIESNIHNFSLDSNNGLTGNTGEMRLSVNTQAPIKKRILLFGDSFFLGTMSILSTLFEEIFYMREGVIIKEVANCLEPDYILTGNAERYLNDVKDAEKLAPYFINLLKSNADMTKLDENTKNAFLLFFEQKNSSNYKNWFLRLNLKVMLKNGNVDAIKELSLSDLDINLVRDYAVSIEGNQINLAYDLMLIALKARPNGTFLKKKITEYEEKLKIKKQ